MRKPAIELQSLVDAHDEPAVIIDCDYKIIAANVTYCESYGISPAEILNHRCHEVSHRSSEPCHEHGEQCPHKAIFEAHVPVQVLHTHFDATGEPDYVRIKSYPLKGAANSTYLLEVIHRIAPDLELSCDDMRMIGRSKAFVGFMENIMAAAKMDAPVLINGESGVGKELAAQFVHKHSALAAGPYIELNCAAIPEALFESEIFGHEKGAFTGCAGARKGLYELADGGTLFLDEIGELPLSIQAKLLRVLDNGEFRRVGGHSLHRANVRVIAATNRDLAKMVEAGSFRADLYYRIAALAVRIPPLRERRRDIGALAEFLAVRIGTQCGQTLHFSRAALQALESYSFPGNVRELRNIVQRAAAHAHDGVIGVEHLNLKPAAEAAENIHTSHAACSDARPISEIEREYTRSLLQQHNGNRKLVASILGISERTLYRRLKSYHSCQHHTPN
ncbi:MAG: sigma-54-dependent Fis family transcriptional regulator [Gammaproteobacteria bacterium]|nr:sigma-54-dependent Fis family transcriptional regulator [Gammaproteobacteria bacterium]